MSFLEEFKKFVLRGNLLDLAVGFTVGAAFSTVAKSLVNDIIMPPVGLLLGGADFSNFLVVLRPGDSSAPPYATLDDAQTAGAVTLNYGAFINNVVALMLVALVMFFLIRAVNRIDRELDKRFDTKDEEGTPANKKCPHCRTTIDYHATRCPYCTSQLELPRTSIA